MPPKNQSILLAGVAVGVISALFSFIPVAGGCLSCLAYLAAGALAVWHYTNTYDLTIPGGTGAGMGALAAALAGLVSGLISYVSEAIGLRPDSVEQARRAMEDSGVDQAQIDQIMEWLASPAFWIGMIVFGIVISAILGAVGGAVGAAMFKRGDQNPGNSPDVF